MNVRRFALYLLLNAIVSATATLLVLWLWSQFHSPAGLAAPPTTAATQAAVLAATDTVAPDAPSSTPAPTITIYVVQSGDTLSNIAEKFAVSVEDILTANGLADPNALSVGQALIIPIGGVVPQPTPLPTAATPVLLPTNPVEPPPPTATQDPDLPLPRLTLIEVQNAGDLTTEAVLIGNSGGPVNLAGWSLRDGAGQQYTFPDLMLFTDGAVYLHTTTGTDTVTDLYWGAAQALWAPGTTLLLNDPEGNLHARYTVP